MKKWLLALTLIYTSSTLLAQRNIDVLHYTNTIELTDRNDSISGTTVIDLLITDNTDQLIIDLKNIDPAGKGMTVTDAGYMIKSKYRKTYEHLADKIIFIGDFSKGDTAEVAIVYKGIPADGLIISKNQFGNRTFFADNWPNRAHNWFPCVDDPADKASVEFAITAPEKYKVVANGLLIRKQH